MDLLDTRYLEHRYSECKEQALLGRWITFQDLYPIYKVLPDVIEQEILGTSENDIPIYKLRIGQGKKKILIWSQMHGNESTGTKAVFDFIKFIGKQTSTEIVNTILEACEITIIPMLNPDGSLAYTRVNANDIDLNRDAVALKAKESKLLRSVLEEVDPEFCFNLHDQRTIFGVEGTTNPATISFLAPSEDEARTITTGRKETMNVIIAMNRLLQQYIPNHIGRYTDEFYPTATGDNFQKLGHNTILIEAGHYPEDYDREKVRKYNFFALLQGIYHISTTDDFSNYEAYFEIPNNQKNFYDVIHRGKKDAKDIAFQYEEKIKNNRFVLELKQEKEGDLSQYSAHQEIISKN